MRKLIKLGFCFICYSTLLAQDLSQDFKNWYLSSLSFKLSKRHTFSVGHLSSFDLTPNNYLHKFSQNQLNFSYRFSDQWIGSIGYAHSLIKGTKTRTPYGRVQAKLSHRVRWNHIRMTNCLRLEHNFTQLAKFQQRLILSNNFQYYNRNWPLRLSPFIKNQVFYYQGGRPVKYWLPEEDSIEEGVAFIEQAPNGWHRYRLTLGVRARLRKRLYASAFYAIQREFNTGLSPYRAIHVPNSSGRIIRSFNNYSLLGISLAYTIKLY